MNLTGDYQSALVQAEKALSIDPKSNFSNGALANAYLAKGDTLKWHDIKKSRWRWSDDEYLIYIDSVFQEHGYIGVIEERIKVNEEVYSSGGSIHLLGMARRYLVVKDYDKAMDYYEKAYEERFGHLGYISLDVIKHPELKDNPRYIALLKKMNLPLPED